MLTISLLPSSPPKTTTNPIAYLQIICVFYVSCNSLIVKVDHRIMLFAIDLERKKNENKIYTDIYKSSKLFKKQKQNIETLQNSYSTWEFSYYIHI